MKEITAIVFLAYSGCPNAGFKNEVKHGFFLLNALAKLRGVGYVRA